MLDPARANGSGPSPLRILVVDDEPLARHHLRDLLRELPGSIVTECGDGRSAAETIAQSTPDLVFLDVAMPGLDGFEVIQAVTPEQMPPVIFVTAHDEHAVRAFEVHALDYLLKPISAARLRDSLRAALQHIRQRRVGELERALRGLLAAGLVPRYREHCLVKRGDRMVVVDLEEVDCIESAGNYVRLHVGDAAMLFRSTLSGIESELAPDSFVRIHRCFLVRADRIRYLDKGFNGDLTVTLRSGKKVPMQRNYAAPVKKLLGA
jgi:two-component system LytT family response regulator